MQMNLETLDRSELEKLISDVESALVVARNRDRQAALKAAESAAAEFGFALHELDDEAFLAKKARLRKPSKPRFANPEDVTQTWTGKGRQPAWYKAAIEAGKTPADLEI